MKKVVIILISLIILSLLGIGGYQLYQYLRIKYAKIEVTLKDDLTLEFLDIKKVSDYIVSINGEILDDYIIDSKEIGPKNIKFKFKNDDNIILTYEYDIQVVDTVKPLVWLNETYSLEKGSSPDFYKSILCGDNYDDRPVCSVEGEYDTNTPGTYPLKFHAVDQSGNEEVLDFDLIIYEPKKNSSSASPTYTPFEHYINNYKTDKTEIGIDISKWQGDVDFDALKAAGVEFIFIRVGSYDLDDKEYFVDAKFIQNIEGANRVGIKAGIYYYSYASTIEEAINDANFVIENIKPYNIELPVVFDWEDWKRFNTYNVSFYKLTNVAIAFMDTVSKAGYEGMLYGSKNYLQKIWLDTNYKTWLAHYIDQTTYDKDYDYWQITSSGTINGIKGAVDIDIRYLKD